MQLRKGNSIGPKCLLLGLLLVAAADSLNDTSTSDNQFYERWNPDFSFTVDKVIIDRQDCKHLMAWEAYKALVLRQGAGLVGCNQNCTDYPGVQACSQKGYVQMLSLTNAGLNGTLPAVWENLLGLTHLDLSHNTLGGSVPPAWTRLERLESLNLSWNRLQGTLPQAWGAHASRSSLLPYSRRFSPLSSLDLSNNEFSGSIPVGRLRGDPRLGVLNLSNNNFHTNLNDISSGISNIEVASDLGLSVVWYSSSPVFLDLSHNRLQGSLPGFITFDTNYLALQGNQLTGTLPENWCQGYWYLHTLLLQDNKLSGSLPSTWAGCKSLESLDISGNEVSGIIPGSWVQLEALRYMSIPGISVQPRNRFVRDWCISSSNPLLISNGVSTFDLRQLCSLRQRRNVALGIMLATVALLAVVVACRSRGGKTLHKTMRCGCLQRLRVVKRLQQCLGGMLLSMGCSEVAVKTGKEALHVVTMATDIVSDMVVLVQVYPRSSSVIWWPFAVLLVALFISNAIAAIAACLSWCRARSKQRHSRLHYAACTAAYFAPFSVCLLGAIVLSSWRSACNLYRNLRSHRHSDSFVPATKDSGVSTSSKHPEAAALGSAAAPQVAASKDPDAAAEGSEAGAASVRWLHAAASSHASLSFKSSRTLSTAEPVVKGIQDRLVPEISSSWAATAAVLVDLYPSRILELLDATKHAELLGLAMALTEDPVSMAATSAFYVLNRRKYGQVLGSATYIVSVGLSLAHMLLEAWKWPPVFKAAGAAQAARDVLDLRSTHSILLGFAGEASLFMPGDAAGDQDVSQHPAPDHNKDAATHASAAYVSAV